MYLKKATTIDDQIAILRERGIIISNEEKAKENLLDIGYFRLGFYCFPFEKDYPSKDNRKHIYNKDTLFEDIVQLYYFDCDFRNLLMKYINRIEINFRTYLTYFVSNKYIDSPTWFADPAIMNTLYANTFETKVYDETFKATPIIKRHHQHHINDKFAPAWKTIEFMTFGSILKLYSNLRSDIIKSQIAKYYGIKSVNVFLNYMETIKVIRNTCAHGGVLFDISLPLSIKNGPAGILDNNQKNNLKGAILVITYILQQISKNRSNDMETQIFQLLTRNKSRKPVKEIIEKCSGYKII
ncbi:Abi family protein [uncultured Bacteroides sp.]|uniref:Abi family protein n=1 Tax=uncultured Bacteroides sp. TaxID=162156 RepID=UPI0025D4D667|nr:Abi family protein [uncultured Bacteroides sp.]